MVHVPMLPKPHGMDAMTLKNARIDKLIEELKAKDDRIAALTEEIFKKDKKISELENQIDGNKE